MAKSKKHGFKVKGTSHETKKARRTKKTKKSSKKRMSHKK
jgi:hypothetical protein